MCIIQLSFPEYYLKIPTERMAMLTWNIRSYRCFVIVSTVICCFSFLRCHPSLNALSSTPKNITLPVPPPSSSNASIDFRDPCMRLPLTPQLWRSLELDDYLKNYPGGHDLPLEDYAEKVGATNFVCGIGKPCNADQICTPVRGRDWYILVATQNWNSFMNDMYQATAFALQLVQGLAISIVNDFAPHNPDYLMITGTFVGVLAGIFGALPGFIFPESMALFGGFVWPFIQGGTGLFTGLIWTYHNVYASLPSDQFSKTSDVDYLLTKAQAETQAKLSNSAQKIIRGGISSDAGLYGVLKEGVFLNNHFSNSERSEEEIQEAISAIARARLIAAIWKATKFFVVRGNTSCQEDGPNGAFPGNDVYSYCDSGGMMMNIVQSKHGKLLDRFPAAHLITAKYNFTTQYFVEHSWRCQEKYGMYSYDPYKNTILPTNPDAECIVSLAVCDMTREDIRKRAKKKGILKACQEVGQLPGI